MTSTYAFIFARGGSKGIPNKNLRLFAGKPLIVWSIDLALSMKRFSKVFVSTDSSDIADVASSAGALVPFLRPQHLAEDTSPELDSWKHALEFLVGSGVSLPDIFVSMPATSPLRLPIDVESCLIEYERKETDLVITVSESIRSPFFNMIKLDEDRNAQLAMVSSIPITRRQDAPVLYDVNTVLYAASPEYVLTTKSLFSGRIRASIVPQERAMDIDTMLDFDLAEFLMKRRLKSEQRSGLR